MRLSQNDVVGLAILKDLEKFRIKMETGEINAGCADWIVRMCEATVADYTQFRGGPRKEWEAQL